MSIFLLLDKPNPPTKSGLKNFSILTIGPLDLQPRTNLRWNSLRFAPNPNVSTVNSRSKRLSDDDLRIIFSLGSSAEDLLNLQDYSLGRVGLSNDGFVKFNQWKQTRQMPEEDDRRKKKRKYERVHETDVGTLRCNHCSTDFSPSRKDGKPGRWTWADGKTASRTSHKCKKTKKQATISRDAQCPNCKSAGHASCIVFKK